MKTFSAAFASAALLAAKANADYGVACVDYTLTHVFDMIDEMRTTADAEAYTDYVTNVYGDSGNESYTLRNNYDSTADVTVTPLVADIDDQHDGLLTDLQAYISDTGAMSSMEWSEGLAEASAEYTAAWQANTSLSSLTTSAGTTTTSRAATYGTVNGSITETAYFYNTYTIDPMDMMRLIITNDGGSNYIASALFSTDAAYLGIYNYIGMSYKTESGCNMSTDGPVNCDMVFDVVVAAGYTNSSDVDTCNTTIEFGGEDCDPEPEAQAVYEAINSMRQQSALWALYITDGDGAALISSVVTMSVDADFDGDGETESRTFVRGTSNIATAASEISAAGILDQLVWEPGLVLAAVDQTEFLEDASSISTAGQGGSTFAQRVAEYGTAGNLSTEIITSGTDSATWIVLSMLIDDLDSSDAGRDALLNSSASQAGVSSTENDTFSFVYVTVIDDSFSADSGTVCEEEIVVIEPESAASLIVAGTAAFAAVLFI